jgi:hypothetical protein
MARGKLATQLLRHVGHTLRCAREAYSVSVYTVDTVALRCEDCGEVVIESQASVSRAKADPDAGPKPPTTGGESEC